MDTDGEKDQSGSDCQIQEWILHRHTPWSRGVSSLVPTRTAKCPIKNESTRNRLRSELWPYESIGRHVLAGQQPQRQRQLEHEPTNGQDYPCRNEVTEASD